jgi:transcriptional regulator with XRE-family HTH domain
MLKLNDVFRLVRDASGLKQTHIADKAGMSHVALSRFEKGQSTLSTETLCSIAPYYFLSDDFIRGENVNPFRSEGKLIKFFISHRVGLISDFSLVQFIIESNPYSMIRFLIPQLSILKAVKYAALDNPVYAIAIKDLDNNIFLFRQKTESILKGAIKVDQLTTHISNLKDKSGIRINSSHTKIGRSLFKKIQEWDTLIKNDVEPLFDNEPLVITDPDEIALIRRYRIKKEVCSRK